ncbi:DUF551 domain-containing protein [Klebsiella pneumoniae]|nr:DUF551 domain-containing protein [Klebsiella pneumoniae]TQD06901.1 DUF551 domain-containing protein [Klebsiella pneumoniae]
MARMALAAMDSESGCLPLDYLQGHKDGLEWAAQLAEANHPETGDWLYDDPIELAKAIRKGPDMPPVQPVADSEPVAIIDQANLDYLRSGADADVWPPEREEMGDVLLYRHPQPAQVVPDGYVMVPKEMTDEIGEAIAMQANCCGGIALDIYDAMLAAAPQSPGSEPATVPGKWIPVSERMPDDDDFVYIWPRPDFGVELHVGQYCECSPKGDGWYAQVYEQNYGIEWHPITVTHWMPLPAAPQEVRGE